MSNLKNSIFWIAFYLTCIVVLAQFDYDDQPIIDFAKYFYLMAIVVIPATIFFPSISKAHVAIPMAAWGAIYVITLQVLDRSASSDGAFGTVILEFVLIEAGAWLGYQLAYGISHAESVMDAMALTAFPNRTVDLQEASKQIKTEFTRSRRFHRPLSLLVLQVASDNHLNIKELIANIQHDLWNRFSFARVGQVIDEQVRQTDMVFRDRSNRFVILCPETDRDNVQNLAIRIVEEIERRAGVHFIWGTADFPGDAINFDDLLDVAVSRMRQVDTKQLGVQPKTENVEVH
jgi:GGDEF domain-containing protein